jgi:hypothetical protein
MKKPDQKIICTNFKEQTNQPIETATELDIVIEAPFSSSDYCQAFFKKSSPSASLNPLHFLIITVPLLKTLSYGSTPWRNS